MGSRMGQGKGEVPSRPSSARSPAISRSGGQERRTGDPRDRSQDPGLIIGIYGPAT